MPAGYSTVVTMPNRDAVTEDAHQCHYCTDFAYFSLIQCSRCRISYCIWHNVHCGCNVPAVQLVYRFTNKELRQFKQQITAATQKDRVKARQQARGSAASPSSANPELISTV